MAVEEKKLFKVRTSHDVVLVTAEDIPDAIKQATEAARRYPARFNRAVNPETVQSVEYDRYAYVE